MLDRGCMMSRGVSLRRMCSYIVSQRIEEALSATVYIVHQAGPTGFVLKQGESKYKVFLGSLHTCTCSVYRKEKELCIHILWLLLKKFRIPKNHSVIFQLGLVEREIQEILNGYLTFQDPKTHDRVSESGSCDRRPISLGDVCPICQNDLLGRPQKLSYCKYGCGKSVHLKCVKLWAEHQKSQGERAIICPLCREKFSTFEELRKELYTKGNWSAKEPLHYGITCSQCGICPIPGKCYKCMSCRSYYLCNSCFTSNHHSVHNFHFQLKPGEVWRTATRGTTDITDDNPSPRALPQSLINDLQMRELSASDYDLLLSLDSNNADDVQAMTASSQLPQIPPPSAPRHLPNQFRTEPLDHDHPLLISEASCQICCGQFQRGEWIRKLPCKHQFHRGCIDTWLNEEGHVTCPVDGKNLYNSTEEAVHHHHQRKRCSHTKLISGTRRTGHIYSRQASGTQSPPMELGILGHSLTTSNGDQNRPCENIPNAHRTLTAIRKGSAIQQLRSAAHHGRSNTAYFDLHVTPIFGSQNSIDSPHGSSPPLLQTGPVPFSGRTGRRSLDASTEGRRTTRKQHHGLIGIPTFTKPSSSVTKRNNSSKLPKIAQNRVDVNSVLRVSSISTSLPPIFSGHNNICN
ncbi:PREDICTED: E3 ubiquitin-protein ligase Zswim2-like [Amphimedon queenslandica]|uniref:SWIM-type domain-containing protein n=1 Tax=Amphimedon queenslandica TaxID=400682 RepID=A0A1X7VQ13_AMPQE|nr:PREDICTED: E3 ubiquitin-protein ligase Zswim2-like [Amphimedon queenslandica]|eukprot:XP_019857524.1 PREDICTED: E3 ubiquitin-protein ligase Zswim2-like [Amphimedon queenslandica]